MNIHQLAYPDDRPTTATSTTSSSTITHLTANHHHHYVTNFSSPFSLSSSRSPSPSPLPLPLPLPREPHRSTSTTSLHSTFSSSSTTATTPSPSASTSTTAIPRMSTDGHPAGVLKDPSSSSSSSSSSRARLMRFPLLHRLAARSSSSAQQRTQQQQQQQQQPQQPSPSVHNRRRSSLCASPAPPQIELAPARDVPTTSHSDPSAHHDAGVFMNYYHDERAESPADGYAGSGSGSYTPSTRTTDIAMPDGRSDGGTIHGGDDDEGFDEMGEPGPPAQYELYDDNEGYHDVEMVSAASTSIRQGSHAYVYENGRRYHWFKEGTYNFPNDAEEQENESLRHELVGQLFEGHLHFAPIGEQPQKILDLGTGTGQWAIEMADTYPSAMVKGVDLSPIQPNWVPPNVRFMVDDIEGGWFYSNPFDLIHARHAALAIRNWPRVLENSYNNLAQGGWVELHELDYIPYSIDPALDVSQTPVGQYWRLVRDGLSELGVSVNMVAEGRLVKALETAGFENVTERIFHVPIGGWAGADGVLWRSLFLESVQATALGPLTRGLGWTREQVELFLVQVRRCYSDEELRLGMTMHVVYGQRPEVGYAGGGGR